MNDFNNMVDCLTSKKATKIPATAQTSRGGAYSLNIVCAKGNRKSMTISKKLAEKLSLSSNVFITAYDTEGYIVLSNTAIDHESVSYKFSNAKNCIVYNAALVQFLSETFELDYSQKTSKSFSDIEFTTSGDTPIAIVTLKKINIEEEEDANENNTQDNS